MTALSKSANKHNRLWASATPLSEDLVATIEAGSIGPFDDPKTRARILSDEHGWDINHARKLWTFGPGDTGANVLVDQTQGVQLINDIKPSVVSGFKWATSQGVLADEPMRGVRLNILDSLVRSRVIIQKTFKPRASFLPSVYRFRFMVPLPCAAAAN